MYQQITHRRSKDRHFLVLLRGGDTGLQQQQYCNDAPPGRCQSILHVQRARFLQKDKYALSIVPSRKMFVMSSVLFGIFVLLTSYLQLMMSHGIHDDQPSTNTLLNLVHLQDERSDIAPIVENFSSSVGAKGAHHSDLQESNERAPVIIIPGSLGSILEAKLDKKGSNDNNSWLCAMKSDWYTLWITESAMVAQNCFFDNIKLRYLAGEDGRTSPKHEGVTVRVPFYGDSVEGVRCLLPQTEVSCKASANWKVVIERFEAIGYQVGADLFSAPYDFRQGPDDFMVDAYPKLKKLVEQVYTQNGRKVKLVSISLGGAFTHTFLTHFVDQEWKDKHIASWLSLAGIFNGFSQSFQNVMFGRNQFLGFPVFKQTDVRDAYRTWFSANWLIPKPLYGDNRVILETPSRQYRLSDIPELLHGDQREMYLRSFRYNVTADPGVSVDCWFTKKKDTSPTGYKTNLEMSSDSFYGPEGIEVQEVLGKGDGTIDAASLSLCERWNSTRSIRYGGRCHGCLLNTPEVADFVAEME